MLTRKPRKPGQYTSLSEIEFVERRINNLRRLRRLQVVDSTFKTVSFRQTHTLSQALLHGFCLFLTAALCFTATAQDPPTTAPGHLDPSPTALASQLETGAPALSSSSESYILGPEDTLLIHVLNAEEITATPYPIDLGGNLYLPRLGRVQAAGLTVNQLQSNLTDRFKEFLQAPIISVSVAEFRSQPISVLGAVDQPGVHQIRGRKTLFEVISEVGGLKTEAGNAIKITRPTASGPIPLPGAKFDPTGQYSVAEVSIRSIMQAQNPAENIAVKPNDVITVPKAELVYVIGDVKRPGGFVLSEKANLSILEALAMAQGLERTAGPKNAKILRPAADSTNRIEIPVDVKKILSGQNSDIPLLANDILFIPNSAAKTASLRAIEAIVQTGTGIAIYGHY